MYRGEETVNQYKNIFITGGTTGIGYSLAKLYLEKNYRVGICGRDLSKLSGELDKYGENLKKYELNVTDLEHLNSAIDDFCSGGQSLDMMIANAGRSVGQKNVMPDFNAARNIIEVNVIGVMNSFEVALKYMLPQKNGHLVAIASVAGFVGLPGAAAYSASKAAVYRLCESFSIDLKKAGITTTAVCPGFIDTPLTKKNNHSMPFIMSADKAAMKIINALDEKKELFVFPWQMHIVIKFLEKLPRFIYRNLMRLKFINYSKG